MSPTWPVQLALSGGLEGWREGETNFYKLLQLIVLTNCVSFLKPKREISPLRRLNSHLSLSASALGIRLLCFQQLWQRLRRRSESWVCAVLISFSAWCGRDSVGGCLSPSVTRLTMCGRSLPSPDEGRDSMCAIRVRAHTLVDGGPEVRPTWAEALHNLKHTEAQQNMESAHLWSSWWEGKHSHENRLRIRLD